MLRFTVFDPKGFAMSRVGMTRMHFKAMNLGTLVFSLGLLSPLAQSADLLELYNKALSYDAGIAAARSAMMAEKESESIALAALLPAVNASASVSVNNVNRDPLSDDNRPAVFSVSLSQPLFNPASWHTLSAAEQSALSAQTVYAAAEQALILTFATTYFNVLRAEENLTTARSEESAVKRQYEQAREQFDVGLISITDVHEAKASHDASQTARIQAEGALTLAFEELSRLTGEEVRKLAKLREDFPVELDTKVSVDDWLQLARQNNLDIRIAQYRLNALEENLKAARSGHLPTLALGAGYEYGDQNNVGHGPQDSDSETTSISLTLNMPLYSGGGTQSRVRQNRHLSEQARHQLDDAKRQASIQARSAFINIRTNVQTVESLQQNIVSRESALEATREGYKVGTRNIVEVLDAERRYYAALRDYLNARFDYIESQLSISRAAGTLSQNDLADLNKWLQEQAAPTPGLTQP
jgi:outer membrane protein